MRSRGRASRQIAVGVVAFFAALVAMTPAAVAAPSLGGRCLMMAGAGHATCRSPVPRALGSSAPAVAPPASDHIGFADFAGVYSVYRLVSATNEHRRCRLQPTCSLFAARAARQLGLLRGLLMGLARSQMSHSDQGGVLPSALASDGQFIYLDPVERWIHGDL
jgi:putative component of membrane protein insertase Oxa1/YidC/SpoIIIJ protein YidD